MHRFELEALSWAIKSNWPLTEVEWHEPRKALALHVGKELQRVVPRFDLEQFVKDCTFGTSQPKSKTNDT